MTVGSLVYTIFSGSPFAETSEFSCSDYFAYSAVTVLMITSATSTDWK